MQTVLKSICKIYSIVHNTLSWYHVSFCVVYNTNSWWIHIIYTCIFLFFKVTSLIDVHSHGYTILTNYLEGLRSIEFCVIYGTSGVHIDQWMGYREYWIFCHGCGDSAMIFTRDKNRLVFTVIHTLFLFLTCYFMAGSSTQPHSPTRFPPHTPPQLHPHPLKQSPIIHFAIFAKDGLFDLALWRHHSSICNVTRTRGYGIATSHSSIVLARINWYKGDLH